jgi:hypothetical protein
MLDGALLRGLHLFMDLPALCMFVHAPSAALMTSPTLWLFPPCVYCYARSSRQHPAQALRDRAAAAARQAVLLLEVLAGEALCLRLLAKPSTTTLAVVAVVVPIRMVVRRGRCQHALWRCWEVRPLVKVAFGDFSCCWQALLLVLMAYCW